jgi:hypothetical protein
VHGIPMGQAGRPPSPLGRGPLSPGQDASTPSEARQTARRLSMSGSGVWSLGAVRRRRPHEIGKGSRAPSPGTGPDEPRYVALRPRLLRLLFGDEGSSSWNGCHAPRTSR